MRLSATDTHTTKSHLSMVKAVVKYLGKNRFPLEYNTAPSVMKSCSELGRGRRLLEVPPLPCEAASS